jgi:hypothetical protein
MVELVREALHTSVTDPVAASMNFLNEVAGRFPAAISLAAGRPFDEFYEVSDVERYLTAYIGHLRGAQGVAEAGASGRPSCTVGPTVSLGEMIARMLDVDEGIHVPAGSIMVTSGCQEAMIVALRGLCAAPEDVVLAVDPCYVGFTGAARVLGITVVGVPETADGLDPAAVARVARRGGPAVAARARPNVVSNFANPSGVSLSEQARRGLIEVAADQDLLILRTTRTAVRPRRRALPDVEGDGHRSAGDLPRLVRQVGVSRRPRGVPGRIRPWSARPATAACWPTSSPRSKSMVTVNTSHRAGRHRWRARVVRFQSAHGQPGEDRVLPAQSAGAAGRVGRHRRPGHHVELAEWWLLAVLDVPVRADEKLLEVSARDYGAVDADELLLSERRRQSGDPALQRADARPGGRGGRPPGEADRRRPVVTDPSASGSFPSTCHRRPWPAVGPRSTTRDRARADAILSPRKRQRSPSRTAHCGSWPGAS